MVDQVEVKAFLYAWLGKTKVVPDYSFRMIGLKARQRFLCELKAEGFPYVGVGNSTNKKDAQTNAARDFIQFLIRSGKMTSQEVPDQTLTFAPSVPEPTADNEPYQHYQPRPVFEGGQGPRDVGPSYLRPDGRVPFPIMDAMKVADAEDLDVNASIHGNWTIENAKSRLHQFFQMNKINADYKYSPVGPDHSSKRKQNNESNFYNSRFKLPVVENGFSSDALFVLYKNLSHVPTTKILSFRADLTIYVRDLGRNIQATDTGSTKQTSSKGCALSMVRQLFHLGVIEGFTGTLKRPKEADSMKAFEVNVDQNLMQNVHSVLQELGVTPKQYVEENVPRSDPESPSSGISLLPDCNKKALKYESDANQAVDGIVAWAPPMPNWNPWTSCNIDEGHMSTASLQQLSNEFLESFRQQQETNKEVQQLLAVRSRLPVYLKRTDIMDAISEHQIILIKGETGSGKTTQICQFILDDYILSGQGAYANIIVTQPRRISTISIAERIANERGEELGQTTGYSVRFESCLPRPYASVLFCTVGVLLRKLEAGLRGVSHVIVDEIHERDINTDFLLIVLRDMLSLYPDLRVILMSATIDVTLFTQFFNSCPVIHVEGREFPVETYFLEDVVEMLSFRPSPDSIRRNKKRKQEDGDAVLPSEDNLNILPPGSGYSDNTVYAMSQLQERDFSFELIGALLTHIKNLKTPGSVLIFLPGWNNIFSLLKYLQEHPLFGSPAYLLLPLHSQLPREDQHRVFHPVESHITKIILSTNIAETSITIDDVVFVIDSCKSKVKLFTSHNNMTTFATVWASKSNLMQRKGRAGRVRQGTCFHLCSRLRFTSLEENMAPEMLRTPLHEIALTIKLLRLGGIGHFLSKAPEPPPIDAVIEAQVLLNELNCLNEKAELTSLGRILAKLPVDPRLGKMIVLGAVFSCADPLAIIAAQSSNLSEVFNLGPENKRLAPQQRSFGAHRHSDHFAILNAFQQWEYQRNKRGEQAEIEFCQQRMLSLPSLRVTSDAKSQLVQVLIQCGFPEEQVLPCTISFREKTPILDTLASLLCAGLYPNVCYHTEKRKVLTTESKAALVHKASVNCSRFEVQFPYPFFIFGEKIRTRAISCKQMTMVTPVHLLLFGSRRVEVVDGMVQLDSWINLHMNPHDAAAIVALRPALENLVVRVSESPESFFPLQDLDQRLVNVVVELSRTDYDPQSGNDNWQQRDSPMQASEQEFETDQDLFPDSGSSIMIEPVTDNRGIKRGFEKDDGQGYDSPLAKRPYMGGPSERGNNFSDRGYGFSPRGYNNRPPGSPRGSFGNRFASPQRGWTPRGNAGGGRFRGSGPRPFGRGGYSRPPRPNYPY